MTFNEFEELYISKLQETNELSNMYITMHYDTIHKNAIDIAINIMWSFTIGNTGISSDYVKMKLDEIMSESADEDKE